MHTLHIISHTHWDREWYLTFQQFRLKLVHMIDGLLDILETDPQFVCFTLDGQTIILDDYTLIRPERQDDLRRYVQNGRITLAPGISCQMSSWSVQRRPSATCWRGSIPPGSLVQR